VPGKIAAALAAVALLAAGCAQVSQIQFDARASGVRSIALVDSPEPGEHIVFNITGAPAIAA
jgi:hypothetical protein